MSESRETGSSEGTEGSESSEDAGESRSSEDAEETGPAGNAEETVSAKDTEEVIMEATFRALSKHGYSDLRMRDIGDEMDLTRQVIHYHFDGKYDLLSAFLEHVIDQYEGSVEVVEDGIDQGVFEPVDAERMGQLVTDVIHAARGRRISLGHEDAPAEARKAIDDFILDSLYADD